MNTTLQKIKTALFITLRESRDQLRDWRVIFPVLGLTIFFPFLMNFTAKAALNFVTKYGASIIADRLVPFLLMVVGFFPISVSLVIALESFVGEKERGSIEPLLNSPLEDWQLYLGKLLSSTLPPLLSSYIGMAVYLGGLLLTHVALPDGMLIFQLVVLTTVQAVVMVAGAEIVSSQTTSVRAANLLASFIVIPAALLIQGESMVVFWGDFNTLWWAVLGMSVFGILLVRVGLAHFRREELLGREIDVLNIKWGWHVYKTEFIRGAKNLREWYAGVWVSVKRLKYPLIIITSLLLVGVWVGYTQSYHFMIPLQQGNVRELTSKFGEVLQVWPYFNFSPVFSIFWQNLRVLIIAMPLGFISFGVLGAMPSFASLAVVGYLMGVLAQAGISPWNYLSAFILPHGILEIPAAILATASLLRMGAGMATPDPIKSVSEVWLELFAEWSKIMIGVVIPLLFIAAIIEAWITPRIALLVFH
jgi:uncharacterized membrane protein SpoIIM required for sporulation/ABC-type transport system involved in multi-copper enzyme maturation permease subunit